MRKPKSNGNRLSSATKRILSKIPLQSSHENIYTVPNILTFSRLIAAPVVGYLLVHNYHAAALSLFAYAGITDLVDGWIARKYHLQTVVGTIIDPMADKLLMTIGVACLAVNGSLPGKCSIDV
jgi:cardiolipin synthase